MSTPDSPAASAARRASSSSLLNARTEVLTFIDRLDVPIGERQQRLDGQGRAEQGRSCSDAPTAAQILQGVDVEADRGCPGARNLQWLQQLWRPVPAAWPSLLTALCNPPRGAFGKWSGWESSGDRVDGVAGFRGPSRSGWRRRGRSSRRNRPRSTRGSARTR